MSQRCVLLFLVLAISFTRRVPASDKAKQDDRVDPSKAVGRLDVHEELQVELFAAEPHVDESIQY